jgi:hypothetical protein
MSKQLYYIKIKQITKKPQLYIDVYNIEVRQGNTHKFNKVPSSKTEIDKEFISYTKFT